MASTLRVRLTGRAARYVSLLADFGHLDAKRGEDLMIVLTERYGRPGRIVSVDLQDVRPAAATLLFANDVDVEHGKSTSSEDWPPLFY